MTISAEVVLDSVSRAGKRILTFQCRYPRFIHAEELTHRVLRTTADLVETVRIPDGLMYDEMLSRNASSSRAIPVKRLIEDVRRDTARPIHWGRNQRGMQAREEHDARVYIGEGSYTREEAWDVAREAAIEAAEAFDAAGYHKQIVNRLLEPFSHINVVVTATEWDNFYALRRHEDAQPEIKRLADLMWEAKEESTPVQRRVHLPYADPGLQLHHAIYQSVARCARVSYMTFDGKASELEADKRLYFTLLSAEPMHASPAEHQAFSRPKPDAAYRNLRGWESWRCLLEDAGASLENLEEYVRG